MEIHKYKGLIVLLPKKKQVRCYEALYNRNAIKYIKQYFTIYLILALLAVRATLESYLQVLIIFFSLPGLHQESQLPAAQLSSVLALPLPSPYHVHTTDLP